MAHKKEAAKTSVLKTEEESVGEHKSNKKPAKVSKKEMIYKVILMIIWVFVSVIASQYLIGMLLVTILGAETASEPVWTAVYSFLSYTIAMLLVIFVPPKLARKWPFLKTWSKDVSREELGLKGVPTWTDIGLSVVAFIVSTVLAMILVYLFNNFAWFNAEQAQDVGFSAIMAPAERVIAFIVLAVLAPIVEEVIFRGWLYGKLRNMLSAPWSILIVSLLFGLMHFQWNVSVNVFALSVVLCVLREITGTIYAGILTHMIKNGIAFILLFVIRL